MLRSERDGYKQAYETLNAEAGALRSDCEGYKRAYETLNAEAGALRSDCEGYKHAYDTLNAEVGALRSDCDGYKRSYETLNAEVGRLRPLAGPAMVRTPAEARRGAGKPSILLVALPKSGTVFVGASLAMTLDYDYAGRPLTSGGFPKDVRLAADRA